MSSQSYTIKSAHLKPKLVAFSANTPPTEAFLEMVAARFRALGEPMRLRIVHALIEGECSVNELVKKTGANQANISRHLQTLVHSGILKRRKEGLYVYYRTANENIVSLCEYVCGDVKKHHNQMNQALK